MWVPHFDQSVNWVLKAEYCEYLMLNTSVTMNGDESQGSNITVRNTGFNDCDNIRTRRLINKTNSHRLSASPQQIIIILVATTT